MRIRAGLRPHSIGAAVVVIAGIGAVAGCAGKSDSTSVTGTPATTSAAAGATADVTIAGCEKGVFDAPVAHLIVTNNSSTARSYAVKVAFDSTDGVTQYDSAFASVSTLAPGQSSPNDAGSLKSIDQKFSCKVVGVTTSPS